MFVISHIVIFIPIHVTKVESIFAPETIINDDAIGLHWFGGHTMSQHYNNLLTEDNYREYDTLFTRLIKMIPKKCHLYWDGSPMSWLNLMTVDSFHKYNPDWKITVYLTKQSPGEISTGPDYLDRLSLNM